MASAAAEMALVKPISNFSSRRTTAVTPKFGMKAGLPKLNHAKYLSSTINMSAAGPRSSATTAPPKKAAKKAIKETLLAPRFYTTDFDEMERLFNTEINKKLNQAEFEALLQEFKTDYNQTHFVRNKEFKEAADQLQGPLRQIFVEFLERSCTAEFSGFLLYKELGRRLKTTYENFRYRYDKKENPYNKGMINNIREIFISRIPPSLNNFRALVQDYDNMVIEPTTLNLAGNLGSTKEKIDIEMGPKLADDSGFSLPEILRNLDYDDMEESFKSKERSGRIDSDHFLFPVEQESRESIQSLSGKDYAHAEERACHESSLCQTTGTSIVKDGAGAQEMIDESHQTTTVHQV